MSVVLEQVLEEIESGEATAFVVEQPQSRSNYVLEGDVLVVEDVDLLDLVHDAEDFPNGLHVPGFHLLNLVTEA